MKKFTKTEITLGLFTSNFIERLTREFNLSDEKKQLLTSIAIEDLAKLFKYRDRDSDKNNHCGND
jgi:hypothetical protein